MLIPQCETVGCLEHIEEVVAIDGVDGIFVGPYDLSTAMGKPGRFTDPEILAAIERVLKACKVVNKPCFIYADSAEKSRKYFAQGFEAVTLSMDSILFIEAMKNLIAQAKQA